MLSVKKLLIKLLEALVVQTSGNWSYVKLGKLFVGMYSSTATLAITSASGSVYQSGAGTISFPETLTNQCTSVTIQTSSYTVWTSITESSNSQVQYRAMSAGSRASASYNIRAITIGKLQ